MDDDKCPIARELDFVYSDYVWSIDDNKLMKKIKKAKHFKSFSSDMFVIKGFKFMMQVLLYLYIYCFCILI